MKYSLSRHACFNIKYHIVFCPKRRKPILVGDIVRDFEQKVVEICKNNDIVVESIAINPDHVHIFVSAKPIIAPHRIVKLIKGCTSGYLRKLYPQTRKLPTLWAPAYYIGTVGYVSDATVKMYIENQKGK